MLQSSSFRRHYHSKTKYCRWNQMLWDKVNTERAETFVPKRRSKTERRIHSRVIEHIFSLEGVRKSYKLGFILTHFQPVFHFYITMKTSENLRFSDVFRGCRTETLVENRLIGRWDWKDKRRWENEAICKAIIWFFLLIMFSPCYRGEIKFILLLLRSCLKHYSRLSLFFICFLILPQYHYGFI